MRMIGKIKQGILKREPENQSKGKAQGMVEFALILPLLIALLFGVIEFGRMIFVYSVVYTASREGARYGSAAGNDNAAGVPNYLDCNGIRNAAERLAILANVQQIIIAYDEGVDADGNPINRTVGCPNYNVEGGKHRISVDVSAEYSTFIPLPSIPNTFTIRSESSRTIISDISIGIFMQPGISVDSLSGWSEPQPEQPNNRWRANIDIGIKNFLNNTEIQDAVVTITWPTGSQYGVCDTGPKSGMSGICTCSTDVSGSCPMRIRQIFSNRSEVTFVITDIDLFPYEYDFSSNNFTSITIPRPSE
jgi:Flp pilus assembly protein TadG